VKPADGCVSHTAGKIKQGALPFCRIETGIAAVWCWDNRHSPLYEFGVAGPEETKNLAGKVLRLIQIR